MKIEHFDDMIQDNSY